MSDEHTMSPADRRAYLMRIPNNELTQDEANELAELEPAVLTAMEPGDPRTHVERINPGPNPAAVPWAAGAYPVPAQPPLNRGFKHLYTMLTKGIHDGILRRPGSTVMLYDDEVGPHHQLTDPASVAPHVPVQQQSVQDPRDVELAQLRTGLAMRDEALSRLARQVADLQETSATHQRTAETLQTQTTGQATTITDLRTTLAASDEKLAAIDGLRDDLAASQRETESLRAQLADRDAKIADLTKPAEMPAPAAAEVAGEQNAERGPFDGAEHHDDPPPAEEHHE